MAGSAASTMSAATATCALSTVPPLAARRSRVCDMWTYDLEGHLVRTPHRGGSNVHTCAGFDQDNLGLMRVCADASMGVVRINIDDHATPLAEYLRPTRDGVAAFDLPLLRKSHLSYEHDFEGDWKLALEGEGTTTPPGCSACEASRPTGKPRCTSSSASSRRGSLAESSTDATLR